MENNLLWKRSWTLLSWPGGSCTAKPPSLNHHQPPENKGQQKYNQSQRLTLKCLNNNGNDAGGGLTFDFFPQLVELEVTCVVSLFEQIWSKTTPPDIISTCLL